MVVLWLIYKKQAFKQCLHGDGQPDNRSDKGSFPLIYHAIRWIAIPEVNKLS